MYRTLECTISEHHVTPTCNVEINLKKWGKSTCV